MLAMTIDGLDDYDFDHDYGHGDASALTKLCRQSFDDHVRVGNL